MSSANLPGCVIVAVLPRNEDKCRPQPRTCVGPIPLHLVFFVLSNLRESRSSSNSFSDQIIRKNVLKSNRSMIETVIAVVECWRLIIEAHTHESRELKNFFRNRKYPENPEPKTISDPKPEPENFRISGFFGPRLFLSLDLPFRAQENLRRTVPPCGDVVGQVAVLEVVVGVGEGAGQAKVRHANLAGMGQENVGRLYNVDADAGEEKNENVTLQYAQHNWQTHTVLTHAVSASNLGFKCFQICPFRGHTLRLQLAKLI